MNNTDSDIRNDLLDYCTTLYDKLLGYRGRYYDEAAKKSRIIRGCLIIIESGFVRLMDAVEDVENWISDNVPGAEE